MPPRPGKFLILLLAVLSGVVVWRGACWPPLLPALHHGFAPSGGATGRMSITRVDGEPVAFCEVAAGQRFIERGRPERPEGIVGRYRVDLGLSPDPAGPTSAWTVRRWISFDRDYWLSECVWREPAPVLPDLTVPPDPDAVLGEGGYLCATEEEMLFAFPEGKSGRYGAPHWEYGMDRNGAHVRPVLVGAPPRRPPGASRRAEDSQVPCRIVWRRGDD